MDMDGMAQRAQGWLEQLTVWLQSPAFLAQLAAIALAIVIAPIVASIIKRAIPMLRIAPADDASLYKLRFVLFRAGKFLRAILLVGLLAVAAILLRGMEPLGEDWLVKIAQSLAVVFLVYRAIKVFVDDPLWRKVAIWTLVPLALLAVLGYFDDLTAALEAVSLGEDSAITLLAVIRLGLFGALFFWLGSLGNERGQSAIRAQESLDVGAREILAKLLQIGVFAAVVFLAFGAAGIPLSGLAVAVGAVGLGIGLGLQPIAANFVSGLIILLDRSVKVGDFVMLEGDVFGRVKAINMRSTTVATADGKDIIVPNTHFTESSYENWTHDSPLQRYEVDFGVSYDTDLDALVPLVRDAVLEHPDVLAEPDEPSVEFRNFGDSSINMCVEFWCQGIDDGPNKFTSDVGFIIWRTLKANNIEIPFPQRVTYQIPMPRAEKGKGR
ncbi:mechanosensitive ion channel family protein [Algimonas porphyrae]|uniref:Mechanosensitive ion channel protein n=2 Tax=Algimonas porphyrae TaxID=1128113 RepID=A0ABQ5V063_9PROT|nr:mechanosensitive ion channel domain-containing protein [Algimonas porphyrae]GLQ20891.1 mechanosensitive ion channel protein [Algimonas porphyrae]